jgi:hypothetical protein
MIRYTIARDLEDALIRANDGRHWPTEEDARRVLANSVSLLGESGLDVWRVSMVGERLARPQVEVAA